MAYEDYYNRDTGAARENLGRASSYYQQSPQSFDTAAARVRNRVNANAATQADQTRARFQNRGLGNSGLYRDAQRKDFRDTQNAYAAGLVDLQGQQDQQNLQRAQGLAGVGQQFAGLGQQGGALGLEQRQQELQKLLGLGSQDVERRGQDINQLLGLGSQDIEKRGQDINQALQQSSQDIQQKLGGMNVLRDLLGAQYEFGNTRLGTGSQATVDAIINFLLSQTGA